MIYFSIEEILLSVLSASVYGLVFAFLAVSIEFSSRILTTALPLLLKACAGGYELSVKEAFAVSRRDKPRRGLRSELYTFALLLLFSVGIILLSYYSLDGTVRIYTVAVSAILARLGYKGIKGALFEVLDCLCIIIIKCVGIIIGKPVFFVRRCACKNFHNFCIFIKKITKKAT